MGMSSDSNHHIKIQLIFSTIIDLKIGQAMFFRNSIVILVETLFT